jgi:hypothetical protein
MSSGGFHVEWSFALLMQKIDSFRMLFLQCIADLTQDWKGSLKGKNYQTPGHRELILLVRCRSADPVMKP